MSDAPRGDEYVQLDVPATTDQLRLVRLVVVGLATAHGSDVDDLEDLRIATGEICAHLVANGVSGSRLVVVASIEASSTPEVRVTATVETGAGAPSVELDELSEMVLETTTHAFGVEASDGSRVAWFERAVHDRAGSLGDQRPDA